ncbi:MAG: EamA family transporter [Hominilimicola sp.]
MFKDSWVIYAILSAFFAALTSILAKIGISDINSNLATAIRTIVVLIMAWGIVFMTGAQSGIQDITAKSWIFLALSGCHRSFLHSTTKHFNSVMFAK